MNGLKVLKAQIKNELSNLETLLDEASDLVKEKYQKAFKRSEKNL